jgi:hypothetical protein
MEAKRRKVDTVVGQKIRPRRAINFEFLRHVMKFHFGLGRDFLRDRRIIGACLIVSATRWQY